MASRFVGDLHMSCGLSGDWGLQLDVRLSNYGARVRGESDAQNLADRVARAGGEAGGIARVRGQTDGCVSTCMS